MCSYKVVKVFFEVWGLQGRVETGVHRVRTHFQFIFITVACWIYCNWQSDNSSADVCDVPLPSPPPLSSPLPGSFWNLNVVRLRSETHAINMWSKGYTFLQNVIKYLPSISYHSAVLMRKSNEIWYPWRAINPLKYWISLISCTEWENHEELNVSIYCAWVLGTVEEDS